MDFPMFTFLILLTPSLYIIKSAPTGVSARKTHCPNCRQTKFIFLQEYEKNRYMHFYRNKNTYSQRKILNFVWQGYYTTK